MLYNEENRNGRWYSGDTLNDEEEKSWYSPEEEADAPEVKAAAESEEAPSEEIPTPETANTGYFVPAGQSERTQKEKKQVSATWRILAIIALALLLCGGATGKILLSLARLRAPVTITASSSEEENDVFDFFDSFDPDDYNDFAKGDGNEENYDVYEYFDNYFSSSSDIRIPAGEKGTGVTLEFSKTSGRELSLQEIYARVNPAVVGVTTYYEGELWSWGTGVVFTADGYLITNAHVLEGCDAADITFPDGDTYEAKYLGSDTATDIAVLKIDGKNLPYAAFADSDNCLVGDSVVAIGNPLGENYAGTMTNGIISAINRTVSNNGYEMTLLQTNAALNEGNSGGPLINDRGEVVGITNMKIMYNYYTTVEGIGFAIPTSIIKPVVDSIIENGLVLGQPTLGIVAGSVSAEAMEKYDLPMGIYVSEVNENSDAGAQGLQAGDIITAVNDTPVSSVDEVNAIKSGLQVGDKITCRVYREGRSFDITFALVDKSVVS